jgi:hypothetical protein
MRRSALLLATLALALLAGCKDSTGSTTHDRVSFTYSGSRSGSFSASGPVPSTSAPWAKAFAGASAASDGYTVSAYSPSTATVGTRLVFLTDQAGGTGAYSSDCSDSGTADRCFFGVIKFDWDGSAPAGTANGVSFGTEHVTLNLTSVTATRMAGTFSGTFVSGAQRITITDGAFDVPVKQL